MDITKWLYKPARTRDFWLPQSGFKGGAIFGVIILASAVFVKIIFFG